MSTHYQPSLTPKTWIELDPPRLIAPTLVRGFGFTVTCASEYCPRLLSSCRENVSLQAHPLDWHNRLTDPVFLSKFAIAKSPHMRNLMLRQF